MCWINPGFPSALCRHTVKNSGQRLGHTPKSMGFGRFRRVRRLPDGMDSRCGNVAEILSATLERVDVGLWLSYTAVIKDIWKILEGD